MQPIQNRSDAECPFDQNLESPLAVAERHGSLGNTWITALHLLGHFLDDGGLAFAQTGPNPLVLCTRGSRRVGRRWPGSAEQTLHDLLWSAHPGRAREPGCHGFYFLSVVLLTFGASPRGLWRSAGLDHRNALAIPRRHQNGARRRLRRALLIKSVKILSGIAQHFLQAAFGNRNAGEVGDGRDRFMEGVLHGRLDQSPL